MGITLATDPDQLAKMLHAHMKGVVATAIKETLRGEIQKQVNAIVDKAVDRVAGVVVERVESWTTYSRMDGKVEFVLSVDGVQKAAEEITKNLSKVLYSLQEGEGHD